MSSARKTDIEGNVAGSLAAAGFLSGGGACNPECCQVSSVLTVRVHLRETCFAEEDGGRG